MASYRATLIWIYIYFYGVYIIKYSGSLDTRTVCNLPSNVWSCGTYTVIIFIGQRDIPAILLYSRRDLPQEHHTFLPAIPSNIPAVSKPETMAHTKEEETEKGGITIV